MTCSFIPRCRLGRRSFAGIISSSGNFVQLLIEDATDQVSGGAHLNCFDRQLPCQPAQCFFSFSVGQVFRSSTDKSSLAMPHFDDLFVLEFGWAPPLTW